MATGTSLAGAVSPPRVLIVGAGIGGLALAHGLRAAGIDFRVFERDAAASPRAQGYRFRINAVGAEALHSVLTPAAWARFEASCAALPAGMVKREPCPGQPNLKAPHRPPMPPVRAGFRAYNADRTVFRQLLLHELDRSDNGEMGDGDDGKSQGKFDDDAETGDGNEKKSQGKYVTFGARCIGVDVDDTSVTARFADGSSARGTILVGADGVGGAVRGLAFGRGDGDSTDASAQPLDTRARCIYGKTPITDAAADKLGPDLMSSTVFVQDRTRGGGATMTLYLEAMRFDRGDAAVAATLPQDYIYWVLGAPTRLLEAAGNEHKDGEDIKDKDDDGKDDAASEQSLTDAARLSLRVTRHWTDAQVRAALELQDAGQTAIIKMRTAAPARLDAWHAAVTSTESRSAGQPRRVTLLGDALHVMPPAGGNGANTALRDAALLARLLKEANASGPSCLSSAISPYEAEMLPYAKEALVGAAGGGKWMFDQPGFDELERLERAERAEREGQAGGLD